MLGNHFKGQGYHFKGQGDHFRVKNFQKFTFLKWSYFLSKRTQSRTKVSRDHFKGQGDDFKGQGDHFNGQTFSKI